MSLVKRNILVVCAFFLALPVTCLAAANLDLDYNYVGGQLGYTHVDPDGPGDNDGIALGANGSFVLAPNVRLVGSYHHGFLDDLGLDRLSMGGGVFTRLNVNTNFRLDAFGNVTFEYINADPDHHASYDDGGFGLRAGLRAKFTPQLEGDVSVGYVDYGSEDGPVFKFTGVYSLPHRQNTAVTLSYQHYSLDHYDLDQLLAGLRLNFG